MAHRADDIRHDIEDTRAAMTEKLAILEGRVWETVAGTQASVEEIVEDVGGIVKDVRGTVEDVKATVDTTLAAVRQGVVGVQASVEEIVEHVKGTVGDTIATVQRTFDLPSQVEQHPWLMFGGALLVGYMLGGRGGGRTLREMFKQAMPTLALHSESAMTKRGGQPIDSPEQHLASMSRAARNGAPS
jgi:hypothetical protein